MQSLLRWRPALRMAWRDLLAHRLRTVVVTLLVALPVAVAVVVSTVALTEDYYSDNSLHTDFGAADAELSVTPWPAVYSEIADRGRYVDFGRAPGVGRAERRDPLAVDVEELLPAGSRVTRVGETELRLATGGRVVATVADLGDPLTLGLAHPIVAGRAPAAPDEVAVPRLVAEELDLLDGTTPADDAVLPLEDGDPLRVVGVVDGRDLYLEDQRSFVVPPGTVALEGVTKDVYFEGPLLPRYLVDLPALSTAEAMDLHRDLAAAGVSAWMRDAVAHPDDWGLTAPLPTPADPVAVAVGALVVGIGLIEVLVLVGATFAVGARRQTRTLGLLISSGATAADVRRTLLAQGVWIGLGAAAVGTGAGLAALGWGRGGLERLSSTTYYDYSFSIGSIVVIALLGVLSAVLAAALPAWGVSRMTASQALDGHVATGSRAGRHRFRNPGLALVATGLVGLALSGWWIARTYGTPAALAARDGGAVVDPGAPVPTVSAVPVVAGGLSALVVLAGTALVLPWLIAAAGRFSGGGWLPWRLATRDATRNRGRTTAAVLAVGIVTTGAVFAGFGVSAQASIPQAASDSGLPDGIGAVYLTAEQATDPATVTALEATLRDVVGADGLVLTSHARLGPNRLVLDRSGQLVLVVDDDYLEAMGAADDARAAFAGGSALVLDPDAVRDGTVVLRGARGRELRLPAVPVEMSTSDGATVVVPAAAARSLGANVAPSGTGLVVAGERGLRGDDSERLSLYGITASTGLEEFGDESVETLVLGGAAGVLVVTGLVVGLVVALSAAEGRADAATLTAVGAPPWVRRATSAGHALFVGGLGAGVGVLLGAAGGASLLQVVGTPGTPVPWAALGLLVVGVPLLSTVVGWAVTPTRLALTRRTG